VSDPVDDDAPNFIVPRLPGTAIVAVLGGVLIVAMLVAVGLRLARGEVLFPDTDTDADTDTDTE